jgi:hypothetical protein
MEETIFRGIVVTKQQILSAMERFDRERRQSYGNWRTYAVEHLSNQYPPKEILSMATGVDVPQFSGGEPTNSRFRELGFKVITIGDDPPLPDDLGISVSLERDLEKFLVANLGQLEPGLSLYAENGKSGQQFDTGIVGRLDILALDKAGDLVVIELKAGEADDQVCGQVLKYMGWVTENLAGKKNVRGIVVASDFSDNIKYAVKLVPGLALIRYEVRFLFRGV